MQIQIAKAANSLNIKQDLKRSVLIEIKQIVLSEMIMPTR